MMTQRKAFLTLVSTAFALSLNGQSLFSDFNEKAGDEESAASSLFSQNEESGSVVEEHKTSNKGPFSSINLNELRKTVLDQMIKDDLIDNKRARVYLFLKDDGITFNDRKLSEELNAKYTQLLAPFEIGTGPNRTIFLSKDCTAAGDFNQNNFHGKAQGRLRIEYTQRPFEFSHN